jgi:hypothetical protein
MSKTRKDRLPARKPVSVKKDQCIAKKADRRRDKQALKEYQRTGRHTS